MELVALNPELGEYFATSQGILVVSASKEGPLKLKGGDVILKIGDRTPATPSQALRILRSYEPGENVVLQVMRKREKLTITVQAPSHGSGSFRWQVESPEPAVAPAAPAGVAAPAAPAAPVAPAKPAPKL